MECVLIYFSSDFFLSIFLLFFFSIHLQCYLDYKKTMLFIQGQLLTPTPFLNYVLTNMDCH